MSLFSQRQKSVGPVVERRSIVLFRSGEKEYGVKTVEIKEVVYTNDIIPLPDTPGDIQGVISLRGVHVPIVHLGKRLGRPANRSVPSEHVVIVEVSGKFYGILVDEVLEVLQVDEKQIDRAEDVPGQESPYIREVFRFGEKIVFIVDLKRLWTGGERDQILPALNRLSSEGFDCPKAE